MKRSKMPGKKSDSTAHFLRRSNPKAVIEEYKNSQNRKL